MKKLQWCYYEPLTRGDGSVEPRAKTKHMLPGGGSWRACSFIGAASTNGARMILAVIFIVTAAMVSLLK
jgi:hypothetical protein